jgi:hypothetical protein
VTLAKRSKDGYEWTVIELVNGETMGFSARRSGENAEPCVLRSSLQCGDQCREVIEEFKNRGV